jgi:hypothetical protein
MKQKTPPAPKVEVPVETAPAARKPFTPQPWAQSIVANLNRNVRNKTPNP